MKARTTMRRSSKSYWTRTMKRRKRRLRRLGLPRKKGAKNRMRMMSMLRMMITLTKKRCWT